MQKISIIIFLFILLITACKQERYSTTLSKISTGKLKLAPVCYTQNPELPSPALTETGREMVLLKISNNKYTFMDATVENGEPFNYKEQLYGKGNQFMANKTDFPYFAKKGIHNKKQLNSTKLITGKSVAQITVDGRPWGSSGVGFMAEDETIMSVIIADNQTVKKLKLTHADIARPLFHFWNISREFEKYNTDTSTNQRMEIESLIYNGHEIEFKITGSRGWQESIFNDEILGSGHIEIWRKLDPEEMDFLKTNYVHLSEEQFQQLQKKLSWFHSSEMVFFYINRYGFYEGHNEYRPDPVTVALIFGLTPIKEAHRACGGNLYDYYKNHFTLNPK